MMMALNYWDIRHRESQLLKNLRTIAYIVIVIPAFVTTLGLFPFLKERVIQRLNTGKNA